MQLFPEYFSSVVGWIYGGSPEIFRDDSVIFNYKENFTVYQDTIFKMVIIIIIIQMLD